MLTLDSGDASTMGAKYAFLRKQLLTTICNFYLNHPRSLLPKFLTIHGLIRKILSAIITRLSRREEGEEKKGGG